MEPFINDEFLLSTEWARRLYHQVAEELPVIDFHNHLDPMALAENRRVEDMAELWINSDPYKHRMMRITGIAEEKITGRDVSHQERFLIWASLLPRLVGSPLFHWSCIELKRFFQIDEILNEANGMEMWNRCNEKLQQSGWGMLDILKQCHVETLCTSDDLLSDVSLHTRASSYGHGIKVIPSLRADSILHLSKEFISLLAEVAGHSISSLQEYLESVNHRMADFDRAQCRFADISLDAGFCFTSCNEQQASSLFGNLLAGICLSEEDIRILQSYLLLYIGRQCAQRRWTMQLHIGAKRDTNTRLRQQVGPAGGYATIGTACDLSSLVSFLDALNQTDELPRTILYTLNPADNAAFATLTGSFAGTGIVGKIQFGPAWWYNDHLEGMYGQLQSLASYGLLSSFIGMTTDSRSVLSFSRHEYFRRVLCRFIGEKVYAGEYPADWEILKNLVENICYWNAKKWSE